MSSNPSDVRCRQDSVVLLGSAVLLAALAAGTLGSCRSPAGHREDADAAAYGIIDSVRKDLVGQDEHFTIATAADTLRRRLLLDQSLPHSDPSSLGSHDVPRIEQWPDESYAAAAAAAAAPMPPWQTQSTLRISLLDALQIAARNSREYQQQKELVFRAALALDLECDHFQMTWAGLISGGIERDLGADPETTTAFVTNDIGVVQRFENGVVMTLNLAFDLVKLLTLGQDSSFGAFADATIAVPLLRGSGSFVVREPLQQAERDVVYAIYGFERFKRVFAVQVATAYYDVLQLQHQVDNELENYRYLIAATRRARRMAEAQRMDQVQVDQTVQKELKARDSWVQASRTADARLDAFKLSLGLPVDAHIELDAAELDALVDASAFKPRAADDERAPADAPVVIRPLSRDGGGRFELLPETAVEVALQHRLDLRVAVGRVFDAQRGVAVAADRLRADLTLFGSATIGDRRTLGDAALQNANLRPKEGRYTALAAVGLPLERTAERNLFRISEIEFEQFVRDAQLVEDQVKLDVREDLRVLLEARERLQIQSQSFQLAERRVDVVSRLLQAGMPQAKARDLLDAQTDLIDSKNSLAIERVRYRVAELALQRDLELLQVDSNGLWTEVDPATLAAGGGH